MIGRIGPRIQERQRRVDNRLMVGRHWLLTGVFLCAASFAEPPPPPTPPPPPPSATPPSPPQSVPDDDFIEFLGGDDVGDEAWWEFLKKVAPRGNTPPATPPQDAKQ
jgi:hypothetical protein